MSVIQEAFDIPDDIMTKLITGEYRRIGGVIRYAIGPKKGQIVKHLESVDLKAVEQPQSFGVKVQQFAKNNKKEIIIATAITVTAAAVGGYAYYKLKISEPAVISEVRAELRIYIAEVREGDLKLNTINDLMEALENLKQHKNYEKYSIALSTDDLDVLVNQIYDYTIKLAKNNGVKLTEKERIQSNKSILNLQNYLEVQKRIFEEVA